MAFCLSIARRVCRNSVRDRTTRSR
jgi:hypothetical protein